jgi:hypothetical protein
VLVKDVVVDGVVVAGVEVVGAGVVVGAVASVVGDAVAVENVTCVWRICADEKNRARLRAEEPLIWEIVMRKPSAAGRSA